MYIYSIYIHIYINIYNVHMHIYKYIRSYSYGNSSIDDGFLLVFIFSFIFYIDL